MSEAMWIIGEIVVGLGMLGALAAVITVWVTQALVRHTSAAEILAERYARGELTREQFRQMRQDLGIVGEPLSAQRAA